MDVETPAQISSSPVRNIVIFSDGTGQRGGVFFDEARTNIYKLYRATRSAPDSVIPPEKQIAFYDPGLGTQPGGAGAIGRAWRTFYNFVSQATGLGITRNIIDCYTAIIQLWRPGDRIFLFGFSRGAYTVRCVAAALCYCGIPTRGDDGKPLKRDDASARRLATRAVKSVYQHVSSPRDRQFQDQRLALAKQFREKYKCDEDIRAFPFFIGVFDTVAALSNSISLATLVGGYVLLLAAVSWALSFVTIQNTAYWTSWLAFSTVCVIAAAYVYTHLKFSFSVPGFHWWQTVHLTTFRQRFYDQSLNDHIGYARHAISVDERRADFQRVRWGVPGLQAVVPKIDRFQQIWFAGNHADVGGGYPENESRLSDTSLNWMVQAAAEGLAEEGLLIDRSVLNLNPSASGMQHDETRSLLFRLAGKSDRDPVPDSTLHDSVIERFNLKGGVQQYDVTAQYRPEALRGHHKFAGAYDNIPLPRQTCFQLIEIALRSWHKERRGIVHPRCDRLYTALKECFMDRIVSCLSLLLLAATVAVGVALVGYQIVSWLQSAVWIPISLESLLGWVRSFGSDWVGLQRIYDWVLALPLSIICVFLGLFIFWIGGRWSSFLYRRAAEAQSKITTPAQTHA